MDSLTPQIVLASSSPRRKMLLQQLDIPFEIRASDIDETMYQRMPPEEFARQLAVDKARAIARALTNTLVLGADTIVVDDLGILGKPQNEQEAFQMLRRLSGKAHRVITGVAIISTYSPTQTSVKHESTQVKIAELSDHEIQRYISTGEPLDKAGAYAIQGKGAMFVEWIHGCYNNVVGLAIISPDSDAQGYNQLHEYVFSLGVISEKRTRVMSVKARVKKFLFGKQKGKTLREKASGDEKRSVKVEETIYNPLQLTINDLIEFTFEAPGTYQIKKMMIATTRGEGKEFRSIKYYLYNTVKVEDTEPLVLEFIQPEVSAQPERYLFYLIDKFEYEAEFLELLEEQTFVISEESEDGEEEIEKEYEKISSMALYAIMITRDQPIKIGKIETWTYELEDEVETLFLTVELDKTDEWITLYEGRKLSDSEFEVYQFCDEESSIRA